MLSIVIPSRVDTYLQRTIDDLLQKAEGEVEIIVVLDGYWPDPVLKNQPHVTVLHQGTIHANLGMREAINAGMNVARGEYVMKIDEHCMVDQGYDVKLAADCEDNWVVVPRRYRLDPDRWVLIQDGRPPIDYMFIDYPYREPGKQSSGLYGSEWRRPGHGGILIDDTMSWQGSCYFMKKKLWDELFDPMDTENYGPFNHEAQEIGNKVWLSGGRLVVNKKTWYAHYHKGKKGKGYGFSNEQYRQFMTAKEKARKYAIDYWLTTKDFKYDWDWLMEKFWPVPNWPDNWKEQIKLDSAKDWSKTGETSEWITQNPASN